MSLLADIVNEANAKELRFLVIGGHAVNAHGFSRFTKDLDLLIRKAERSGWEGLLLAREFSLLHDGGTFIQFRAPGTFLWPLDLMLVSDETFELMFAAASPVDWNGMRVRMPSLDGLLALKFHALKHGPQKRNLKDLLDVLTLAEVNEVDVRSDKFRLLCEKYGGTQVYERVVAFATGNP